MLNLKALTQRENEAKKELRAFSVRMAFSPYFSILVILTSLRFALLQPAGFEQIHTYTLVYVPISISYAQITFALWFLPIVAVRLATGKIPFFLIALTAVALTKPVEAAIILSLVPKAHFLSHSYLSTFVGVTLSEAVVACSVAMIFLVIRESGFQEIIDKYGLEIGLFRPFQTQTTCQAEELQALLSRPVQGRIRHIVADNKYVLVTTENGTQLLALSLTAAIDRVIPNSGLRVHRSVWIAWSNMGRVIYENGNPRLITKTGDVFPVSRKNAAVLKRKLEQNLQETG